MKAQTVKLVTEFTQFWRVTQGDGSHTYYDKALSYNEALALAGGSSSHLTTISGFGVVDATTTTTKIVNVFSDLDEAVKAAAGPEIVNDSKTENGGNDTANDDSDTGQEPADKSDERAGSKSSGKTAGSGK